MAVTTADWTDGEVAADLLEQVEGPMQQIDADGAYDNRATYEAAMARGADRVVPPRATAVPWAADHPRTQAIKEISEQGLAAWQQRTQYHRRSLAENARYRLKLDLSPGRGKGRQARSIPAPWFAGDTKS